MNGLSNEPISDGRVLVDASVGGSGKSGPSLLISHTAPLLRYGHLGTVTYWQFIMFRLLLLNGE